MIFSRAGHWLQMMMGWGCAWLLAPGAGTPISARAAVTSAKSAGEELFAGGVVPKLEFQIAPAAMKVLQEYHQVREG